MPRVNYRFLALIPVGEVAEVGHGAVDRKEAAEELLCGVGRSVDRITITR